MQSTRNHVQTSDGSLWELMDDHENMITDKDDVIPQI